MVFRCHWSVRTVLTLSIIFLLLFSVQASARDRSGASDSADKAFVLDGRVVHDVGLLQNNVTNSNLIGSRPTNPSSMNHAPSGRWPGESGTNFLWSGNFWVGGRLDSDLGQALCSNSMEFQPSEAEFDTIYPGHHGLQGGNRFPWPQADDDQDGVEDEDPLNGLDDDGDGLVDEDFAGISEQQYRCVMRDDTDLAIEYYPDHVPMGLSVVQESFQWDMPLITNAIGYEYTVSNVGTHTIHDVYLGIFGDFDIGTSSDDLAAVWDGPVVASDGHSYPVTVAYMKDGAAGPSVQGLQGWVVLGHTTDAEGLIAPTEVRAHAVRSIRGGFPFHLGGDPTNDAERYELMSQGGYSSPSTAAADYRVLSSSGPFPTLIPGQSLKYQVALVAGINLEELKANAAEMVACYRGREFERENELVRVNWIPLAQEIVPARIGTLVSRVVPQGLQITIETNMPSAGGLTLVRRSGVAGPERIWRGAELLVNDPTTNRMRCDVIDSDEGQGIRHYDLMLEDSGSMLMLAQLDSRLPELTRVALTAHPNPFNPSLAIEFALPQAGHVRLQIFDVRGRLVRNLLNEDRPTGSGTIMWHGLDDQGRAMASGVYQLKLETAGRVAEKRVTLVR